MLTALRKMYEAASRHFELLEQPEVCMFTGALVPPRLRDKPETIALNTDGVAQRMAQASSERAVESHAGAKLRPPSFDPNM